MYHKKMKQALPGIAAGTVNGLFGAAGGMLLVPLLQKNGIDENQLFPTAVAISLPLCITSLLIRCMTQSLPWRFAWPFLAGSAAGGIIAVLIGKKIPAAWLHRGFGLMIIWGGIKSLC